MLGDFAQDFEDLLGSLVVGCAIDESRFLIWIFDFPSLDEGMRGVGIVSGVENKGFGNPLKAAGPLDMLE